MRRGGGARYAEENDPRQRQLTPPDVLEPVRDLLGGIALDPCTEPGNPTGAERWYAPPVDGCAEPWDARNVYCNPPYGRARQRWVEKCISTSRARPVVLLIPAHTEVELVQRAMRSFASACFVAGRLRFALVRANGRRETASHGSVLLSSIDLAPLTRIGTVVRP